MHLRKVIEETELRFLTCKLKGETFMLFGKGQSKISSKKWKKIMKNNS